MNLASISSELRQKIMEREECIGFVVYNGKYHWILAWEGHFNLDHKKNLDAYLMKGRFKDKADYEAALVEYRGGIPTLTHALFPRFLDGCWAKRVDTSLLREEFFSEDVGQYVNLSAAIEQSISFGSAQSEDIVQLRIRLFSLLPKFYINYDRRIFMHMVRGRSYEATVLDGWWGAEGDFEHMVPVSHRYWTRMLNEDYWAVTNFSNYE